MGSRPRIVLACSPLQPRDWSSVFDGFGSDNETLVQGVLVQEFDNPIEVLGPIL